MGLFRGKQQPYWRLSCVKVIIWADPFHKEKYHVKNHLFMTQLAAGFAAKGLLNLMTSSPVATGLAHLILII